ncbi:MAG: glycosyltransferase family 2 protein [Bacteroidales bacterium]|jgi:glycosyltransferase involved in cell wall biosynthesis|nr:glycosyltransferase family 2 protein [Bacteroidales bacterium]
MNLSVGIITYNEEKDLPRTLNAVKDIADEIVIVDNGSTDKTPEIAASFNAKLFTEKWKGYGEQKNSVIDKCHGKWILLIDADEEITPQLKKKIQEIISGDSTKHKVYKIRFTTVCFGKRIRHGGWSNFYRVRLFNNGAGRYDHKQVHETFITEESIGRIKEMILHYTYTNLEDYFDKFNAYTSKMAVQYFNKGKKKSIPGICIGSIFRFFKMYILKLGFLDGYEGYLLSRISSMYVLVKYSKLRELKNKDSGI